MTDQCCLKNLDKQSVENRHFESLLEGDPYNL